MSRRTLFALVLALSALAFGCSKEEPAQRPPATLGQTDPMIEVKAQLAKDPKNTEALYHMADLYDRSEMYPEAVDTLLKLLKIDPNYGYAHVKLASCYDRLGRYPDAIVHYKIAAKLFPKNPVVYNNIAFAYGKIGKVDEQIASLKHAISIRPHYATARFNLGMVYLRKKDRRGALEQYKALNEFDEPTATSLKQEIDKSEGKRR